jgi:hypothetical protein
MSSAANLRTVQQVAEAYPAFTEGGLRWLIFNAEENGFSSAIVRVGRRVLIDLEELDRWIDARRQA